jgi:cation transport ATPase
LDFYSDLEHAEKVDGEEYSKQASSSEPQAEWEAGQRRSSQKETGEGNVSRSRIERRNKLAGSEDNVGVTPQSRTSSKPRPSLKSVNLKLPSMKVNLAIKIAAVIAVLFNFRYDMGLMKDPVGTFTFNYLVIKLAISVGINFAAVWILFAKQSRIKYFLSLFAVLASFLYYIYDNYTNHTLLVRSHLIPSVLVILSVLMLVNSRSNYYLKSIMLMVFATAGIYLSSNQFALEWVLMGSAGLVMFFRVSKTQRNDKSTKKESMGRRNQRQSA